MIAELKQRESSLLLEIHQLKSEQSKQTEIGEMQADGSECSKEELLKMKYEKERELSEENNRLQQQCKNVEKLQQMLQEQSDDLAYCRQQVDEKAQLVEKYQKESQQLKQVLDTVLDTEVRIFFFL